MKKIIFGAAVLAMMTAACSADKKNAGELFQRAEVSFAKGDYSLAKLQIDSIRTLYPKAIDVRKAAIGLMQQIDLHEQQKTVAYLDSMMQIKQAVLDAIKEKFVFEKDTAYQEVGNYFYPTQVVEKNVGRSFLRAQVNERGEMLLTSIYCGAGNIHHTAVKVSNGGDTFAQTPVSSDGYETTDLGRVIEKADYRLPNDGGVTAFVESNSEKKSLKLEFLGDRNYKTQMPASDIKAITEVADLARVLAGMEEIRKELQEANLKIKFITRKMQEAEAESKEK